MLRRYVSIILLLSAVILSTAATTSAPSRPDGYEVIEAYPHDPQAFTQGLIFVDGFLYETTGLEGKSSLRRVDLTTGRVLQKYDLPAEYFGEGLTDWGTNLIQITWRSHTGFVYSRYSFNLQRTFNYDGEGWGLTHDNAHIIMSDGTAYLRFLDPQTFRVARRLRVVDESGHAVDNLNELEYINGEIYANIWHKDEIVRISPESGKILGRIDLTGIIDKRTLGEGDAVLNGIAYDAVNRRLFVTGKLWPKLFEIKVVPHAGK